MFSEDPPRRSVKRRLDFRATIMIEPLTQLPWETRTYTHTLYYNYECASEVSSHLLYYCKQAA